MSGDFRRAIRDIAQKNLSESDGSLIGTRKISGYVANIHEDGELAGTIDVQEFNYDTEEYEYEGAGYHEGVKVCATQENGCGVLIMPLMFSEVVIVQNPIDMSEYVIAWSHAKTVAVKSHEGIEIGVIEHEPFQETEDGLQKDYDELEETGNKAVTTYDKETIRDEVMAGEEGLVEEKKPDKKTIQVGDTKITIDGANVTVETSGNVTFKVGGTEIAEKDGQVSIKTDTAKVEATDITAKGSNITVNGSQVKITGGTLTTQGAASADMNGPYTPIKICPFSGAPHCGSQVSGT